MTLEEQIASLQAENTELESHIHAGVKEIARLNGLRAQDQQHLFHLEGALAIASEGNAKIIATLDAAVQLTEALIMFMPLDGQAIPPDIVEMKAALSEALTAIGMRK